jgi:hypothetical protein
MKRQSLTRILLLGLLILLDVGSGSTQEPSSTQESAIIGVPEFIKAGEDLRFTIKLDKAPSFDGGVIQFSLTVGGTVSTTTPPISAGQKDVPVIFHIPATTKGGKCTIHILGFWTGLDTVPIKAPDIYFEVVPNSNLILPTAAEIQINPSQIQLLRRASFSLQLQVQEFKAALAQHGQGSSASLDAVIQRNFVEALGALKKTQLSFRELGDANAKGDNERIFFDDLQYSYEEVLKSLSREQKKTSSTSRDVNVWGSLVNASQTKAPNSESPILAQAALRPFLRSL